MEPTAAVNTSAARSSRLAEIMSCILRQVTTLLSLIGRLGRELTWSTKEFSAPLEEEMRRNNAGKLDTLPRQRDAVFLAHGRNLAAKDRVARFVERLGVDVVVLDECAGEGRTIIENLELHGDVAYAVVLLTGDDVGGLNGAGVEEQRLRARQNVILELGYFLGRLRRSRVCVLYEEGIEIPTDYSGTLWVKFDELGAWRLSLVKELRAAGLRVDLERVL